MSLSIIIPSLGNNRELIQKRIQEIRASVQEPYQIILSDGSKNKSLSSFNDEPFIDYISHNTIGRGAAMDMGASIATQPILVFLHEDTSFPLHADQEIKKAIDEGFIGGALKKRFNESSILLFYLQYLSHIRSKLRHIFFGDQMIFVKKDVFEQANGFKGDPLYEDVLFSKQMNQLGKTKYISSVSVMTSGEKIHNAPIRYSLTTWKIKLFAAFGVSPEQLFKIYYKK